MSKYNIGNHVVATVAFFEPDEEHGMGWYPMAGDMGKIVAIFHLDTGEDIYDVEFSGDFEPGSWPMGEDEIAIIERQ